MFKVIVYNKATRRIVAYLPFEFSNPVRLGDYLMMDNFGLAMFKDTEPVVYMDEYGYFCLKENSFIINSDLLKD